MGGCNARHQSLTFAIARPDAAFGGEADIAKTVPDVRF